MNMQSVNSFVIRFSLNNFLTRNGLKIQCHLVLVTSYRDQVFLIGKYDIHNRNATCVGILMIIRGRREKEESPPFSFYRPQIWL